MEATSLAPLPPRPGDQYRLRNLRSSMRNVMTRRSKMSSAISTTDSTEEPNHRLHWLPRLDRRVTICEGERHGTMGQRVQGGLRQRSPSLSSHPPSCLRTPTIPSGLPWPPAAALPPRNTQLLIGITQRKLAMRPVAMGCVSRAFSPSSGHHVPPTAQPSGPSPGSPPSNPLNLTLGPTPTFLGPSGPTEGKRCFP